MSVSAVSIVRSCRRAFRKVSTHPPTYLAPVAFSQRHRHTPHRRWQSTAAVPANAKISGIVDQISQLTLLETADLVSNLKSRLNIPDMPIGNFSSGLASGAAAPAAPSPEEEEEAAPAAQEKTLFTLTLKSIEAGTKPKIIKEIKSMLGLSLVDSKKFVESAPKQMKEGVPKEEAEKIVEMMKGIGAAITME